MSDALGELSHAEWEAVVRQSIDHGTTGLLCHHLLAVGGPDLHDDLRAACESYLHTSAQSFGRGLHELQRLLDALAAAGIAALPIKGPGLAVRIYPDPALRRFRDLDLLIRPAHREPALAVLAALGYSTRQQDLPPNRLRDYYDYSGQDILFAPGCFPIEPHWALAPRTLSADIDVDGLFARAVEVDAPVLGRCRGLSPEDSLIFAALHGAKEEWSRLVWLSDMAALFDAWPALDAAVALERARACGCRRMLLLAALLARDVVGASVPTMLIEAALADRAVPALAEQVRRRLPLSEGETRGVYQLTRFRWRMRERAADRLRYGLRTLLTPREEHFRSVPLPDPLGRALYPVIGLGYDLLARPLWQALKRLRSTGARRATPAGHSDASPLA